MLVHEASSFWEPAMDSKLVHQISKTPSGCSGYPSTAMSLGQNDEDLPDLQMEVSKNGGTPKSYTLIGVSITNPFHFGVPPF